MACPFYLIAALISFVATYAKTGSFKKAAVAGALVGAGAYYVQTETEWGRDVLGDVDGPVDGSTEGGTKTVPVDVNDPSKGTRTIPEDSTPQYGADGVLVRIVDAAGGVLKSWGADGTAKVIGTTAIVSSDAFSKLLPWLLPLGILLFLK